MSVRPKNWDAEVANAKVMLAMRMKLVKTRRSTSKPNELISVELDVMGGIYASILLDVSRIAVRGSDTFRATAMDDVATIMQTRCGRRLLAKLEALDRSHFDKMISIEDITSQTHDPNRSQSRHSATFLLDEAGEIIYHTDPDLKTKMKPIYDSSGKSGTGLSSIVVYEAGTRVEMGREGESSSDWAKDVPSHVLLFHELTHAYRNAMGSVPPGDKQAVVSKTGPGENITPSEMIATGLGQYATEELSENTYRSERIALGDKMSLRTGYDATL